VYILFLNIKKNIVEQIYIQSVIQKLFSIRVTKYVIDICCIFVSYLNNEY